MRGSDRRRRRAVLTLRNQWTPSGASAQAPSRTPAERVVPVQVAMAVRKPVPLRIEALGSVAPMASVAIKARLETRSSASIFRTARRSRPVIGCSRSTVARCRHKSFRLRVRCTRDKAQLEGAERDVKRFTELLARNAGTGVNVDNAKTQSRYVARHG